MFLAHIFLPTMLFVICKSQQNPPQYPNVFENQETIGIYGDAMLTGDRKLLPTITNSNDEILDRYRKLTVQSLLGLRDSCQAHDFFQYLKHNMENDFGENNFFFFYNDTVSSLDFKYSFYFCS